MNVKNDPVTEIREEVSSEIEYAQKIVAQTIGDNDASIEVTNFDEDREYARLLMIIDHTSVDSKYNLLSLGQRLDYAGFSLLGKTSNGKARFVKEVNLTDGEA